MEQVKITTPRLFLTSTVENKDEIEEKLERSYGFLQNLISGLSDKEAHDVLNNTVCKDKNYEEVSVGLLVSVLADINNAPKSYRDLTLITRDGFGLVLTHLNQIVVERYLRLNDVARSQLLWLLREMIRNGVSNVDNLCWNIMRHAAGGDISQKNINLIECLVDIYQENRSWLDKYPLLIASVVYTYLRLIEDHNLPYLLALRQKEVNFMIALIRERFHDCLNIGRDLVRLLQNVARIPEFEQLWKDILINPKSLVPNFTGVLQLLQIRTSRRFLQSRLTPEMERKLAFLTSQVRFGNHKRYQDWFQRQYLSTPESQSLRCDMIRFIVGVIHPTNELLCSDIIPRWAVIGWLLTTCTSSVAVSNSKLALFYDWLFYDSEKDNIMNIEPAILVMHHSMRSHPAVSATLLDFLCRIIANFYPPLMEKVRSGVFSSLRQILEKRVLPSLQPLFDNAKLDRELRTMIRETFKEFCIVQVTESSSRSDDFSPKEDMDASDTRTNSTLINNHSSDNEPVFSDEEEDQRLVIHTPEDDTDDDDIPLARVRLKEKVLPEKGDTNLIDGPLKIALNRLQTEKEKSKQCQAMESVVQQVLDLDLDLDVLTALAKCLCSATQDDLKPESFPNEFSEDTLQNSINGPFFVLFKNLYKLCKQEDKRRHQLVTLLAEMYNQQMNVGYLLLFFLKAMTIDDKKEESTKSNNLKSSVYKEFCQGVEKKVDVCLYDDLSECHVSDNNLMMWIVPDLYKDFKQQTVNNVPILKVIISTIDAKQLQDLVCKILQGRLVMFKSDTLQPVLKASLSWESIEQYFLWQLLLAHDISLETFLPLLPHLDFAKHSEALTTIMLMLKQEKPTADLVKYLFSRDIRNTGGDIFVFSTLKHWCRDSMDKVGDLISSLLSTRYPATSPNKRKRSGNKNLNSTVPSADQVLGHLDQIRLLSEKDDGLNLYNLDSLQRALQQAHNNSNESQKKQFSTLFALAEEEEETTVPSNKRGRGRKTSGKGNTKKPSARDISDSSEESSEEEEIVKPKQAKKRKKTVVSDSD